MEFKRYGGVFTGRDGGGNIDVAVIGVYLLVGSCVLAIATASAGFVVLGFALLFIFTVIGMFSPGGTTANLCLAQKEKHLKQAAMLFKQQELTQARESFRKAKIYGRIPIRYMSMYRRAMEAAED